MISQKRKKNKLNIIFILIVLASCFTVDNIAKTEECKKFDIKCKTKKWVDDTKGFQKKKFDEGKNQLNESKEKIIKSLPKK